MSDNGESETHGGWWQEWHLAIEYLFQQILFEPCTHGKVNANQS